MQRKTVRLIVILALVLLSAPRADHAQPATKVYRIGVVRPATASANASDNQAFTQRLQELGYTEGQNLVIEARFANGQLERVPALVTELVQLQVDCLVVAGTVTAHAAKQATSAIPIVMINASEDPVRLGLITSLARPGGNITGVINIAEQLAGKRLELLKEAFPHLARNRHLLYNAQCQHFAQRNAYRNLIGKFFWKVLPVHAMLRPDISEDLYAKDAVEVHADIASQGWQRAMNMEDQPDNAHYRRDGIHRTAHGSRVPGRG